MAIYQLDKNKPPPLWMRAVKPLLFVLHPPLKAASETTTKLAWLVLLRWLAVLSMGSMSLLAYELDFVPPHVLPIILVVVCSLALLNGLHCATLNLKKHIQRNHPAELLFFLCIDWLGFIYILALTRGIDNPFYPLIYIYAMTAASLLPGALSFFYICLMGLCIYLLNPVVFVFSNQQTFVRLSSLHTWLIQFGVLALLWGLATWLSSHLQSYRAEVQQLTDREQRLKSLGFLEALGAGFSHELATPLNTIKLRLERHLRSLETTPHDLEKALKALQQCEQRLRSLAKLPHRHNFEDLPALPIGQTVAQLIKAWESQQAQEVKLQLALHLPQEHHLKIPRLLLQQAINNLLDNAAQASPLQPPIGVQLSTTAEVLQLEIWDQGEGWPATVREHQGEPFNSTRENGTGLGLFMVQIMMDTLGGRLELLDNHPKGARVRLCFPLT